MNLLDPLLRADPAQLATGLCAAQNAIGAAIAEERLAQRALDRALVADDPLALRRARAALDRAEADKRRSSAILDAILGRLVTFDAA